MLGIARLLQSCRNINCDSLSFELVFFARFLVMSHTPHMYLFDIVKDSGLGKMN